MPEDFIPIVSHESEAYQLLFHHFLRHTDQKFRAKRWLNQLVDRMSPRQLFVDVGAGDGSLTNDLVPRFDRAIALEPNPKFCEELRKTPQLDVRPQTFEQATGISGADLVLCSHVFYLVPAKEWLASIRRLTEWLSPTGSLVISGQSRHTDCQDLIEHFYGSRHDLSRIAEFKPDLEALGYSLTVQHVESHIDSPDLPTTIKIAEFILNRTGVAHGPSRTELEAFVRRNYVQPSGHYQLSCHQDFHWIRKASAVPKDGE